MSGEGVKSTAAIAALLALQQKKIQTKAETPPPSSPPPHVPVKRSGSSKTPSLSPEPIDLYRTDNEGSMKRPISEISTDDTVSSVCDVQVVNTPHWKGTAHLHDSAGTLPTYDRKRVPSGTTTFNKSAKPHDIRSCRRVENFKRLNEIAEGTFGKVWRALDTVTKRVMALKQVKMEEEEKEGFPLTALREVDVLMNLSHENIVDVKEIVVGPRHDSVYLVMEYVEHDMKFLMDGLKHRWSISETKCLALQLLKAVAFMHQNWVIHRDLKTSNLLYTNRGVLKVCDFGLARLVGRQEVNLTPGTCTLWYRSPEVLLDATDYTATSDNWAVGCIIAELVTGTAILQTRTEADQLVKMFDLLGQPCTKEWPAYTSLPGIKVDANKIQPATASKLRSLFSQDPSEKNYLPEDGYSLVSSLLIYNPDHRLTAEAALQSTFFESGVQAIEMMPTFPATNDKPRSKLRAMLKK
eukprot:TRINITY_DN28097_c0_g1_i1.p1 TRINITY_DN28097_c0_g1~~TRINITY_DN28097_c0_g1_i1.p1  ORF type:complete len:466 (+),score=88.35 TRINITY_DN28097_c0_g1_i1:49-1446(+)